MKVRNTRKGPCEGIPGGGVGVVDPARPGVAAFLKAGFLVPFEAIGTAPAGADVPTLQDHLRAAIEEIERRGALLSARAQEISDAHAALADAGVKIAAHEATIARLTADLHALNADLAAATAPAKPAKGKPAAGE